MHSLSNRLPRLQPSGITALLIGIGVVLILIRIPVVQIFGAIAILAGLAVPILLSSKPVQRVTAEDWEDDEQPVFQIPASGSSPTPARWWSSHEASDRAATAGMPHERFDKLIRALSRSSTRDRQQVQVEESNPAQQWSTEDVVDGIMYLLQQERLKSSPQTFQSMLEQVRTELERQKVDETKTRRVVNTVPIQTVDKAEQSPQSQPQRGMGSSREV